MSDATQDSAERPDSTPLGFDPDVLKAKYRAERDKRLRADGSAQYIEIKGQFAHYLDDPYVEPIQRAPLADEVEVVVIGGGFGGLLAGARLRQAGVHDIRIVEKGGDFGGTWYWNRYPGAACDVESYIYLPLLEELNYMPVEKYSRAAEILAHCKAIGRTFRLYENACFQTEVTGLIWDEDAARWTIKTQRGDAMKARYVVMASGPLHRPKLPGIAGVETFKGHSFHTSRWDYAYTGGDCNGNLTGLKDKRVAVIGTGATAVQCVPHLGAWAQELYVFQRTPSSIDVRANRPTDPEWAKNLVPGWQRHRMENFNALVSGVLQEENLVGDGWTDIIANLLTLSRKSGDGKLTADAAVALQLADFKKMESIRARVDATIKEKATAEALKPWYNQFCKRPCFHDEYLDTFNRANVHLIDTHGKGVERITEHSLIADGHEYEIDCLVYATGFEVNTSYTRRAGLEVHGRDGLSLTDKWSKGVATLHGMHSRGFPNLFIVSNSQAALTVNFPHLLNEQAIHLAYIVEQCRDRQARVVETTQEAEDAWVDKIIQSALVGKRFQEECTPGYYNNEGQPSALAARNGPYGAGAIAFIKLLEEWRAAGRLEGLQLR